MRYNYRCPNGHVSEYVTKMGNAVPERRGCPDCELTAARVFVVPPVHYGCDGFHTTDYIKGNDGGTGDKRERLNKIWSKDMGEAPPPPARDVK